MPAKVFIYAVFISATSRRSSIAHTQRCAAGENLWRDFNFAPPPPSLGVKFNCLANCQGNKTMQIPLNFITNCCKLKRVLSLFFSIVLPVEKFDLLAGKPPPIKTICRNKKEKKIQQARRKFLCAANIFGWLWVAHAVVLQQLTLIVWPALLHSLGAHTTICWTIRKSIRFFFHASFGGFQSVCSILFKEVTRFLFWSFLAYWIKPLLWDMNARNFN